MTRRSRISTVAALLAAVTLALLAPAPQGSTLAGAPRKTEVTVVAGAEVTTLDPNMDTFIDHKRVLGNIYNFLVSRDDDMKIIPELAVSWKLLNDTTWQFKLRPNVKFHDGTAFTAEDVKFTIDRVKDPALRSRQIIFVQDIARVDVVDPLTVNIVTKAPYPLLLARMSATPMVSKAIVTRVGNKTHAEQPVGTGPYRLAEWKRGESVTLVRNPGYWGGAPQVERVIFKSITEPQTRVAALLTGQADIIKEVPSDSIRQINDTPGLQVAGVPSVRVTHISLDVAVKPLDDVRIRQALNYAVDVDGIIKYVMNGRAYRANGLIDPTTFGHNPKVKPYAQDINKARRLLGEAGLSQGFTLRFVVPQGEDRQVAEALVGQMRRVGIRPDFELIEYPTMLRQITERKQPPMYFFSWGSSSFDADGTLYPKLACGQLYSHFCNRDLQSILDRARTILDQSERLKIYHRAAEMVHDLAPVIFLYQKQDLYGVRKGINWRARADEMIWFHRVTVN